MRSLAVALLLLAIPLGVFLWQRGEGVGPGRDGTAAAPAAEGSAAPQEPPGLVPPPSATPTGGGRDPAPAPASDPGLERLRARWAELRERGAGPAEWQAFVSEVLARGTPEAIGIALEVLADETVGLPSTTWAVLLGDVEDERIGPAALALLMRRLDAGRDSWAQTQGLVDLIAGHLDAPGAAFLARALGGSGEVARRAAIHAGVLVPRLGTAAVLELAAGSEYSAEIYDSLAALGDEAVTIELEQGLPGGPLASEPRREEQIGRALGRHLSLEQLALWTQRFWAGDGAERARTLAVIGGLGENPALSSTERLEQVFPLLQSVLQDPADPLLPVALKRIAYDSSYHVAEVVPTLEALQLALAGSGPEIEELHRQARIALERVQKSLASRPGQ